MARTPKSKSNGKLNQLAADLRLDADFQASAARDKELRKLQQQAEDLKHKYDEICLESASLESQVEFLTGISGEASTKSYERLVSKKSDGVTVVIGCFDWHIEERVDPSTVRNMNSYDLDEAERRVQKLWSKSLEMLDFVHGLAPVHKIVLAIGGDLISGYIHEELIEGAQLSPTQASLEVIDKVIGGIKLLHKETSLPIEVVTAFGNHGRSSIKRKIATGYKNSYEWMSYKIMAKQTLAMGLPVRWQIGNGYHNIVDVEGHKLRVHHGDAIRFEGGVGGITIPVNKAIAAWNKATPVYHDLFGHLHTYLPHWPRWTCSGCLIGYSPFAVEVKAEYQRPTQPLLVFDRVQGLTLQIPIFVTDS